MNNILSDDKTAHSRQSIIFVTGASRSGTTMLSRILGNQKYVLGLNEMHYFGDLWEFGNESELSDDKMEKIASLLFARQARGIWGDGPTDAECLKAKQLVSELSLENKTGTGLFSKVMAALAKDEGKQIVCEQTPRNIYYAKQLLEAYPDAFVVHIIRDPRAVLASQKNRWQMRRLGGKNVPFMELARTWFNYHPVTMCKLWKKANEIAIQLTDHPRFKILRFEDLVNNPEKQVSELCEFLSLEFDLSMIDVPQWGSSTIKHGENKTGIAKEVANKWEEILGKGELLICEYMTRGLMDKLSYEPKYSGSLMSLSLIPSLLRYPVHIAGMLITNPRRVWIQFKAIFIGNK